MPYAVPEAAPPTAIAFRWKPIAPAGGVASFETLTLSKMEVFSAAVL
jgi:hypothetical protein